ncbi:hypothetical protein OGATHE_004121 [Ogataea polymorpha]|uniref:Uncharacterized protein n=1 Tax=Ogataea polymorpha TaxID=460523 RepID=A0A9P8P5A2_9ASCO|nr:hypothetical protein OGATHE_004121 [Ogataea polymorpha]
MEPSVEYDHSSFLSSSNGFVTQFPCVPLENALASRTDSLTGGRMCSARNPDSCSVCDVLDGTCKLNWTMGSGLTVSELTEESVIPCKSDTDADKAGAVRIMAGVRLLVSKHTYLATRMKTLLACMPPPAASSTRNIEDGSFLAK